MAFLGKSELQRLLPSHIDPFTEDRIAEAAYELCLGNEVFLTDSTSGKKEILDDKNSQVVIKPGQFALLLTQETVKIPVDKIAFISIKFSQKIKGLVNISGFHVDPGFNGKIIFSVYNAGPATIVLDKGKPYFMIWFSELKGTTEAYNGKHNQQNTISADQISLLKGDLASPNALLDRLKKVEELLNNLKWVAGIIIGIGITISAKSCYDYSKFNEGYYIGIREKEVIEKVKSLNIDSNANIKVDSILRIKSSQNGSQQTK